MRFRAEQHLRRQSDIRAVREKGRRLECRSFTVWWKARTPTVTPAGSARPVSNTAERPRVCVIASTHAVGSAVQRNRAKRRLREVFRQNQQRVPAGCDLLLIARAAATAAPLPDLEKRFVDACIQIEAATKGA